MAADYRFQAYWDISLGGTPYRLPIIVADHEGKLDQWLNRNRTLVDSQIAAAFPASQIHPEIAEPYRGHPQSDARSISIPNWPPPPPLEVNTVYVPTGLTRYTRAAFLVTTTVKDLIVAYKATGARMPLMHVHSSESDTGPGRQIYLEPLSPRPLSPYLQSVGSAFGADEMLWLLPMVDIRYFWQNKSTTSFSALSVGSGWQTLIETMASQITTEPGAWGLKASNGVGDGPLRGESVEAEYLTPHPTPFGRPLNLVAALESAAWSINRRWVHGEAFNGDTGDEAMRAIGPASAATQLPNSLAYSYGVPAMFATQVYNRLTRGGDIDAAIRPTPSRIAFSFPCYDNGIFTGTNERSYSAAAGEYSAFPQVGDASGSLASDQSIVILTAFGSTSSNYASLNGTHANSTELTDLVEKYGQDWYAWRARQFDYTFAGVVPWTFTGYEDAALYHVGSPMPGGGQRIETRVWSLPPDVVCRTQLSRSTQRGTAIAGAGAGSIGQSFYEDPDESLPRAMVGRLVYSGGQLRVAVNGLNNSNVLLKQANIIPATVKTWVYDTAAPGLHAKSFKVDGSPARAYADFATVTDANRDGTEVMVIQGSSNAWTAFGIPSEMVSGT